MVLFLDIFPPYLFRLEKLLQLLPWTEIGPFMSSMAVTLVQVKDLRVGSCLMLLRMVRPYLIRYYSPIHECSPKASRQISVR